MFRTTVLYINQRKGIKEMKKKLFIVGSCIMVSAMGLTACGQREKSNATEENKVVESASAAVETKMEGNHMTCELMENIKIDAEVQGQEITSCTTYNTAGKTFDKSTMEEIFWKDTSELKSEEDKEENSYWIEDSVGGSLYADSGSLSYEINDSVNDLLILVGYCYVNEMREKSQEEKTAILQTSTVQNAMQKLNEIYQLGDGEEFSILQGVKINMEDIIKTQNDNNMSDMKTMTQDMLGNDAYYLAFAVEKQGVPLASQVEPDIISVSENPNTQTTGITMIVDENGIKLLSIQGAYELNEETNETIITAQEAVGYVAKEYENQISEDSVTFDKVWLEYVFSSGTSLTEFSSGTLQPYWIFVDSNENMAERINAITGENFKYE